MNGYMKAAGVGGLAGGLVVGLAFLVLGSGLLLGRDSAPAMAFTAASQEQPSHEDMHRMMDAVHGDGTSQRMNEAMGPDKEMLDEYWHRSLEKRFWGGERLARAFGPSPPG